MAVTEYNFKIILYNVLSEFNALSNIIHCSTIEATCDAINMCRRLGYQTLVGCTQQDFNQLTDQFLKRHIDKIYILGNNTVYTLKNTTQITGPTEKDVHSILEAFLQLGAADLIHDQANAAANLGENSITTMHLSDADRLLERVVNLNNSAR